jgi:hypothetical protein
MGCFCEVAKNNTHKRQSVPIFADCPKSHLNKKKQIPPDKRVARISQKSMGLPKRGCPIS